MNAYEQAKLKLNHAVDGLLAFDTKHWGELNGQFTGEPIYTILKMQGDPAVVLETARKAHSLRTKRGILVSVVEERMSRLLKAESAEATNLNRKS